MKIAFCLYKYFPYGGLQRDFMRVAEACRQRGHEIRIYVHSWQGEKPAGVDIVPVRVRAYSNHRRNTLYSQWVTKHLQAYPVDVVVGFNKMPGLDVYYAADVCYAEKVAAEKGFFYRLTARYRHYMAFEKAVFSPESHVELMMLTDRQIADFKKHYHTPDARFHILPPGISQERKYSQQPPDCRYQIRVKNKIPQDDFLLLQVGSDFRRKGVDRTLHALAALPDALRLKTRLFVVGQDNAARFKKLAAGLGIEKQVSFFSGRDDVAQLMAAADLLMHPAYQEAAGIVLLEAIAAGLPILTTDVCGYAPYITRADCGIVIPQPWTQDNLNQALSLALQENALRTVWAANARRFADEEDLYSLPEKAADLILGIKHG